METSHYLLHILLCMRAYVLLSKHLHACSAQTSLSLLSSSPPLTELILNQTRRSVPLVLLFEGVLFISAQGEWVLSPPVPALLRQSASQFPNARPRRSGSYAFVSELLDVAGGSKRITCSVRGCLSTDFAEIAQGSFNKRETA